MFVCTAHVRDCDYHVLHPEQNCRYSDVCGICTSRAAQRAGRKQSRRRA
jgi:hypothetical protein